ncbi:hypothetical protein, partial [Polaribacter sargassicola]|uniref:hypothetical protein n=1 Tax=Polaribacter sargassicola TaxID=2836891 RepID=UPI001F3E2316
INPRSAQLYAPDQGAAMALIFTLMVFAIGYGLQGLLARRAIGRARKAVAAPDLTSLSAAPGGGGADASATATIAVAKHRTRAPGR